MTTRVCYYGKAIPAGIYERDGDQLTLWTDDGPIDARPILRPALPGCKSIGGRTATAARIRILDALGVDRREFKA